MTTSVPNSALSRCGDTRAGGDCQGAQGEMAIDTANARTPTKANAILGHENGFGVIVGLVTAVAVSSAAPLISSSI